MPKFGSLGQGELCLDTVRVFTEENRVHLIASAQSRGNSAEYLPFTPRPRLPPKEARRGIAYTRDGVTLHYDDALELYATWPEPVCIISDGAYGVSGFPGDPPTHAGLADWYRPHIEAWSARATPLTTLWFWNTEVGWATVHPVLVANGWEYVACHVWNKGLGHVAGNANTKTLRQFPIVTEVCVQYVKPARFRVGDVTLSMQDWLRHEWRRSGLPMYLANEVCGVKNAATRKYLASDHVWYYPPPAAFEAMAAYINAKGDPSGRPYFSVNGKRAMTAAEWDRMRAKFHCAFGVNNVWSAPPVRGVERLKAVGAKCLHANQKPLSLLELTIRAATDEGDMVWDPFGGLCSVSIAARRLGRRAMSAETERTFFLAACDRLASDDAI